MARELPQKDSGCCGVLQGDHGEEPVQVDVTEVFPNGCQQLTRGFEVWGLILRVLDAFRPRGATWSGQVISSLTGRSGGPSMTHLLPGGGVPRVHRARSPVPPRLLHFPSPRSVHQFGALAAGGYPPCRPPNAWSPGVPALPGPCYWLVASGTPVGWRLGCLALGLLRGAVRHYCLGGCSALVVCARRSRPVRGGWGRCRVLCLPRFPLPAPRFLRCVWRAVPSGCPLSSLAGTPFHAVCALRGLGPVALLVFPACPLCVCALALARRLHPPPLPGLVLRAHLARFRCLARVGPFHLVRAPPRVLPRSCAPFGFLGGGGAPGPTSPYLAWGCALPVGWVRAWRPVTNPTARALGSVGGAMSVCTQPRCGTHTPPWAGWWVLNHQIHASTRLSETCAPGVTSACSCRTKISVVAPCGRGTTAKSLFGLTSRRCYRRAATSSLEGVEARMP